MPSRIKNDPVTAFVMVKRVACVWAVLFALQVAASTHAALSLPMVLGDHMVLQRDTAVPIWGMADPGAEVVVTFAGQEKQTTADDAGRWRVDLDPMPASAEPRVLRVESNGESVERSDVLVGDVWLCAGQSNMQMGLARAADGEAETVRANDPLLRLLRVENHVVPCGEDAAGEWSASSPDSARRFSAAGYYFGVELRKELDVPVGLICSAWGATGVESWLPIEAIRSEPAFASILERDRQRAADRPGLEVEYEAAKAKWQTERDAAKAAGKQPPNPPRMPMALRPQSQSGSLYDAMVLPLAPYAMRGAVWYQGESNVGQGERYQAMLTRLIGSWRQAWGQSKFYFGIVQLPNYHAIAAEPGDSDWALLREAQRLTAESVTDTGLAVTIDLGEADNGHPKNKRGVGERLARLVMTDVYGSTAAGHGPMLQAVEFHNGEAVLTFAPGPGGLHTIDGGVIGAFAVRGPDQRWHWAQARVVAPRVLHVWSDEVTQPMAVQYAWADNPPTPNLTDDSNLPASPFRVSE